VHELVAAKAAGTGSPARPVAAKTSSGAPDLTAVLRQSIDALKAQTKPAPRTRKTTAKAS
jgi:non-homologous end joining protein Ku